MKNFYVYMMASGPQGTLYIGSTDNLAHRVHEHREKVRRGFTAKYNVTRLVWFETFELRENAFRRERRMKEWKRAWKIRLIERDNPTWEDLGERLNELLVFR
jgi:putative endonuclease